MQNLSESQMTQSDICKIMQSVGPIDACDDQKKSIDLDLQKKIFDDFALSKQISSADYKDCKLIAHERHPSKNRYPHIITFEHSMATLDGLTYSEQNYFNGNYIRDRDGKARFIACQGPLECTTDDFWQVVVRNNCERVIGRPAPANRRRVQDRSLRQKVPFVLSVDDARTRRERVVQDHAERRGL